MGRDGGCAGEARRVEWWAHSRAHPSGHQLHFDSDNEGEAGLRHPIVTSVCYLSEGVGGPTLITEQRPHDARLACNGWLVAPKTNRFVVFDTFWRNLETATSKLTLFWTTFREGLYGSWKLTSEFTPIQFNLP